jgi:DNA-directed RNA polymerase specialized sigma24 family protein
MKELSSDQVKYAYITCERISFKYLDTPALGRDDLVQIGMEAIVKTLSRHEHLWEYNAWMGKVATWAMNDALSKVLGRRGLTRQGRPRQLREPILSLELEEEVGLESELGDHIIAQELLGLLTEAQQEAVLLLHQGYNQTEVGKILDITSSAVMLRRQAAGRRIS